MPSNERSKSTKRNSFKSHPVSAAEKLWLKEVAREAPLFDRRIAKVKLLGKVPQDFDPDKIDPRLCREGKLTPIGLWYIDPDNMVYSAMDSIITKIREMIIAQPGISEVSAPNLALATGIDQKFVASALKSIGELGSFSSGAQHSPDGQGYSVLSLTGPYAYDEYLTYRSVDDLLERYYTNREPGSGAVPWGPPTILTGASMASYFDSPKSEKAIKPNTAFVLMAMDPTKPELEDAYGAIKDICMDYGIAAYRADEIEHQDRITDRILEEIQTCEYLIADLSFERPNVYYEVGYAHAINKKPILYRRSGTNLHFDLSVHNVPEYKNNTELRDFLRRRLSAILGRDPKPRNSKNRPVARRKMTPSTKTR